MSVRLWVPVLFATHLLGAAGCVKLKPVVLASKTQLENQLLGTFERLESELILASSVRAVQAAQKPLSPLEREALEASMLRAFNQDDIDALKAKAVVGEARNGLLAVLAAPEDPVERARMERLIKEENHSREVIMQRALQLERTLSAKDLPLVQRLFYQLNVKNAKPGERVQRPSGDWEVVQAQEASGS